MKETRLPRVSVCLFHLDCQFPQAVKFRDELVKAFAICSAPVCKGQSLVEEKASPSIFHNFSCHGRVKEGSIGIQQKLELCKTMDAVKPFLRTHHTTNMFFEKIVAPKK